MADITLKAMPFDSNEIIDPDTGAVSYDRGAYSRDLADWMRSYFSNGVLVPGGGAIKSELKVIPGAAMACTVNPGGIIINGRSAWVEQPTDLTLSVGGVFPRIDRIVIELNLPDDRCVYLKVLEGFPSDSPEPRPLTQTEDLWQMSLAQARVEAGQAVIASVTDERADPELCGISSVTIGVAQPSGDSALNIVLSDEGRNAVNGRANVEHAVKYLSDWNYRNRVEILTSQNWTVPAGVTNVDIALVGGGAGGLNSSTTGTGSVYNNGGAGGGGGEFEFFRNVPVTPGTVYQAIIGAGGGPGGNGGETSFLGKSAPGGKTGVYFGSSITIGGSGGNGGGSTSGRGGSGGNPANRSYSSSSTVIAGTSVSGSTIDPYTGIYYAGGGGGGAGGGMSSFTAENGGKGGGGAGGGIGSNGNGVSGAANTGGGGGGAGASNSTSPTIGGSGGSGIIIIYY